MILTNRVVVVSWIAFFSGLILLSTNSAFTQSSVKSQSPIIEHRVKKSNPVVLQIQTFRGEIQWQQSAAGSDWQNWRDKTSPVLEFVSSNDLYIRAAVFSENCDPVFTSAVHVTTFDKPTVETVELTTVLATDAQCVGKVVDDGRDPVTKRGVCWSIHDLPDVQGEHTSNGAGLGSFTGSMSALEPATLYYVRAYAINNAGIAYGEQMHFTTTRLVTLPTVITANVTGISSTTATCGGDVTDEGETTVQSRGVCWNTTGSPTIGDFTTSDGTGFGPFVSQMTGLKPATRYYVRAYASKCIGTAYGEEKQFETAGGLN
jgi:hypothetical protein